MQWFSAHCTHDQCTCSATCIESHKTHTAGIEYNFEGGGGADQRVVRDLTLMMRVEIASLQPSVSLLSHRLEGESVVCAVKHSVRIITT